MSLWLAANLKKEADLPAGASDPVIGADQPSARYYALASSAEFLQHVLARAIGDQNSAVAIGAIEALARTCGAKSLVKPVAGSAQPLVGALSYPDRHVRFLAAASLAKALPQARFTGYQLVMPALNEALRQTGRKAAVIISENLETLNELKDVVRAAGYDVIDSADPVEALTAARQSSGVDVIVMTAGSNPPDVIAMLRGDENFLTLPAVVLADSQRLRTLAANDGRIVLLASADDSAAVAQAIGKALTLGTGEPMTLDQASGWAVRAAGCIRLLGMTGNEVYDISRTRKSLIAALGDERSQVKVAAAAALAVMPAGQAQQALIAPAGDDQLAEDVRIKVFAALSESLRRFGNQLAEDQAQSVLRIVADTDQTAALRDAAAQSLGAMNLPSDQIKLLILDTVGNG